MLARRERMRARTVAPARSASPTNFERATRIELPCEFSAPDRKPKSRRLGFGLFRGLVPGAGAGIVVRLSLGRENVVVHPNHHRNEHDRIVEKMQFHAREKELQ